MIIVSFLTCLFIFLIIGLYSIRQKKNTAEDYLLASRSLQPWLCGLSAVATTNSGFMFTAWIGMTYAMGISSIWFLLGLSSGITFGLFSSSRHIREVSEKNQTYSYGGLISLWQGSEMPILRHILGWGIVIFLSTYAAAQLTASSKAMYVLFDWDLNTGAIIGAIVIFLYCYSGGFRASVWTDVAQSIVMMAAMIILLFVAINEIGGFTALYQKLAAIDPSLVSLLPNLHFSPWLYIFGWFLGGIGITGQPHVMTRFMALDDADNTNNSLYWYLTWYYAFFLTSWGVGLAAKVLLPEVSNFDAELALPMIANDLLPQFLVGIILAGLFAASISTADSLVLASSAALSRDILKQPSPSMLITKGSTVLITIIVLAISLWGNKSVFVLVTLAWSALATAITPLLYLMIWKQKINEWLAISMVICGTITVFAWHFGQVDRFIWPSLPGIAVVIIIYFSYQFYRTKFTT